MRYSDILKTINIQEELEKRNITGKVSGDNLMVCCVFHNEENPSMGINIDSGLYQCLSCGEVGNFFTLISFLDKIKYKQAEKLYEDKIEKIIKVPELKKKMLEKLSNKEQTKIGKPKAMKRDFLKDFVKPQGQYLQYLLNRKITKQSIEKFGILCCNDIEHYWEGRIIIPIEDEAGKLIGVTARYAGECDKIDKVRKVKGSDVGKVLFGLKHIMNKKELIIVEGEIDTIFLQQFNIPAVMTGKHPSDWQLNKLINTCEKVIICLDGDVSKNEIEGLKKRINGYLKTEIIYLPEDKDPNDLTEKEVKEIFKDYIRRKL